MKIPFEDFDSDGVLNADQKITPVEKALTDVLGLVVSMVIKRTGEAKTYGDMYKLNTYITAKFDEYNTKMETIADALFENTEPTMRQVIDELTEVLDVLKGHKGDMY